MSKSFDDKWDDEFERWTPRRIKTWVAIAIGLCVFLPVVGWGIHVATSGVRGTGEVIVRENDADNRIGAQAFFENAYANIQATDTKINTAAQALADFELTPRPVGDNVAATRYDQQLQQLRNELRGLQSNCQDTIASYNAEARKTIRNDWRSADLPYEIDQSKPSFDCQPTNR